MSIFCNACSIPSSSISVMSSSRLASSSMASAAYLFAFSTKLMPSSLRFFSSCAIAFLSRPLSEFHFLVALYQLGMLVFIESSMIIPRLNAIADIAEDFMALPIPLHMPPL